MAIRANAIAEGLCAPEDYPHKDSLPDSGCKKSTNQLLDTLPSYEYDKLAPDLKLVRLAYKAVLYQPGDPIRDIYFPVSGIQSLLSITESGASVEVGIVGNEGMLGIPAVLESNSMPYQVVVQVEGTALMIKASALRSEFLQGGSLHHLLLRYTSALIVQITQSVICNRFHSLEERICRRLLVIHDYVESGEFRLTQEFLSHLLGARRQGVTEIASHLQKKGFIRYLNGNITILDHRGLESCTCECYKIVKDAYTQILGI
jgi:CRP-like cAMP-binding protein